MKYENAAEELRFVLSPSSRRAWIEIREKNSVAKTERVALLAEGVD